MSQNADKLNEITKDLVKKEKQNLLNELMKDPVPSQILTNLIVDRVIEINNLLRS